MRKNISIMLVLLPLIFLCACSEGKAEMPPPDSDRVDITIEFNKQSGYATNQFAIWIEDADGKLIQTLYTTRFTANGGYKNRPDSIPLWAEKSGLASMAKTDIDALTGATPGSGEITYYWDLTDQDGNMVPPGEYGFFVEGSLRWKNRVLYSGKIEIGGDSATINAQAEFFYEAADNQPALSDDAPEAGMIGSVTARYVPAEN